MRMKQYEVPHLYEWKVLVTQQNRTGQNRKVMITTTSVPFQSCSCNATDVRLCVWLSKHLCLCASASSSRSALEL